MNLYQYGVHVNHDWLVFPNEWDVIVDTVCCTGADPFQSVALPETVEDLLEDHVAKCIAYNRWGTLLAGGTPSYATCMLEPEQRCPTAGHQH